MHKLEVLFAYRDKLRKLGTKFLNNEITYDEYLNLTNIATVKADGLYRKCAK